MNMNGLGIGFAPVKIDHGEDTHIISGVSGQLLKVDDELNHISSVSQPFPAMITSSTVLGAKWIGVWIERDLRQARMAAFDINDEWLNGDSKADLRVRKLNLNLHPSSSIWSQILDSEPTGLSVIKNTLCFSTINRAIYRIDGESNEIWRAEIPKWEEIERINSFDEVIGFVDTPDGIVLISKAGGFAILNNDAKIISKGVLKLPEIITGFSYKEGKGWFIKLNGKCFATLSTLSDSPKIYKVSGPIYDVINKEDEWIWTGWRHDGKLNKMGELIINPRDSIGIGIIGDNVLTNDGIWEKIKL
tara:strand:+ start:2431 stop:3339 length:909 start_codon:yes stop_codon:yes gene_type:complete